MNPQQPLLLAFDLTGTFVFALNDVLTAVRAARLDVVAVVALGMMFKVSDARLAAQQGV